MFWWLFEDMDMSGEVRWRMPYIAYWLIGWIVLLPVEKTHIEPIMTTRILDPIYVE